MKSKIIAYSTADSAQLFAVRSFESIKEVSGDQVKVFNWHPALTYEMFWYWGPEKLGGCGNVHKKVSEEAERTGRQYIEVLQEVIITSQTRDI